MKHLTLTSRSLIEKYLSNGYSFREIADKIGYSVSTVSREIKRNRTIVTPRLSACAIYSECSLRGLCDCCNSLRQNCKSCRLVNCCEICDEFESVKCKKLEQAPFVCNVCSKQDFCKKEHAYYSAIKADTNSRKVASASRETPHLSDNEICELNALVSPLIKNGQSLNHIYANHGNEIPISRRTMYRYVDNCILDARNLDLPRKVRYSKRKPKQKETFPYKYREGRTYEDYKAFIELHPDICVVEMDTVKGKREKGKCLLTMIFTKYDFMLLFLLDSASQNCVQEVFDYLTKALGLTVFRRLFSVILTDNGSEFKNPEGIEKNKYGSLCTNVFYCDRMASWQKPHIERSHEFIRQVLPKGCSFDELTQEDITLLCNHINSFSRDSLGGLCPYDAAKEFIAKKLPFVLNLRKIPPDEVRLNPSLLN